MLTNPGEKYRPWPPISLPDRRWPDFPITHAPRWLSTDLRDGNQALAEPMDSARKLQFVSCCWSADLKRLKSPSPRHHRPTSTSSVS